MADLPNTGYNKAIGAAAGGGLGGAITVLVVALVWHTNDPNIVISLNTVISSALGFLGAYLPQHKNGGG